MRTRLYAVGNITVDELVSGKNVKGYAPGGVSSIAKYWSFFVDPEEIALVSKIGDDNYVKDVVDAELGKLGIDNSFITRVPRGGARIYNIDITNPAKPQINRKQEDMNVTNTHYQKIDLDRVGLIYFQTFAAFFEHPQADEFVSLTEEANGKGVPVYFDLNIRQGSIKLIESMENRIRRALRNLDTLKGNEGEIAILNNPRYGEKIEKITLREEELPEIASRICEKYEVKRLVVSMGKRGSFLYTKDERLRLPALHMPRFVNSLGAGDGLGAGDSLGRVRTTNGRTILNDTESLFLGNLLGGLATVKHPDPNIVTGAYPSHITRELIVETVQNNKSLFDEYGIKTDVFLDKVGLR